MSDATTPEPQCPPVPDALMDIIHHRFHTRREAAQRGANWGFTQGLAAAQRLADEERRRGADEELEAVCSYIASDGAWFANPEHRLRELRSARRPPAPTKREQALAALRRQLDDPELPVCGERSAMELALQALEEAGDER